MAWKVLRSFRFKLLSGSLLLLSLLLLAMGLFEYTVMQGYLNRSAATNLKDQVHAIGPQVWDQIAAGSPTAQSSLPKLLGPDVALALVNPAGTLQPINRDERHPHPVPALSPEQYQVLFTPGSKPDWSGIALGEDGRREMVVLLRFGSPGKAAYLVQASIFLKPTEDILHESLAAYGLGALVTLLLGALTFRFLIRRMLSPLSGMVQSLERMDAGTLQERLSPQETDELNSLAHSFNSLLARLETAFIREKEARETLRRFVADASHELRTPLTALHGFLEVLLLGAVENPEQRHSALQSMHMESERLIKLVNDLLLLARFDREPTINREKACLADLLKEIEPELRLLARNRSVELEIHDPGCLSCDMRHIKQVILNLFHNAVHYTDPLTGKIKLVLTRSEAKLLLSNAGLLSSYIGQPSNIGQLITPAPVLVLEIHDNGSGILPEDLPHVFERFYRGEKSRSREQGGTGLGLAIVKSIVEAHSGRVSVESVLGQGAVFRVELPI
ncbi:MAG: sensor histidine kinase [Desulfitobacteriaceae bacterium]